MPTTISKDANKYFVSILVEVPFTKPIINPTSVVGLDLGIKDFISNGEKLKNEVKVNEKRLKGLQKDLARCKPESKNRNKLKLKTQRLYLKIRNARKHMIYKLANKIYERKYNINKNEIDKNNRWRSSEVGLPEKP